MADERISELDAKATPADADQVVIVDEAAAPDQTKKVTWANVKATLKTYFDTLYALLSHKDRHDPEDGADPLDCAAASEIAGVQAAAEGSAHSFARSDHAHQIQHGILDNHIVTIDDADAAANDYCRLTANGIEGREYSEVAGDIASSILENPPTEDLATKAPTSEWAYDHNAATTGVHGAGAGTIAIATTAAMTLYVDAGSGSDENAGTSGSPKATIQGALDALPPIIVHTCTIKVRGQQNYAESNTALDLSRFSTLEYIVLEAVNSSDEDMFDNGTADAGAGNDELDDATKSWSVDQFNGAYVWIYGGTGAGQIREISDTTATKLTVTVNWTTNPDATSYYAIGGGATLTGTGAYHIVGYGKMFKVYGFKHSGATYDIYGRLKSSMSAYYNYCTDSEKAIFFQDLSDGFAYYNYILSTVRGIQILGIATCCPRANLIDMSDTANSIGIDASRGSVAQMWPTASELNYLKDCAKGTDATYGGGLMNADSQTYDSCASDYSADASSWYT